MTEGNRILKVRPDKANPRSEGYCCRKGLKIAHYQNHQERLTRPLKKKGGGFEEISWDQAFGEIADKIATVRNQRGPHSFAYVGGGGQGCHLEAAYGVRLLRALGSHYHYSPLAQELTGMFWVQGRALGRQYLGTIPDDHQTDLLLAIGWNGWMSHQMPQARRVLKRISEDPSRLLVVIDPRRSETAERADIHLALRPGTDALLTKAMIAIILQEGWQQSDYIADHVSGFDSVRALFDDFDAKSAVEVCELNFETVREVCRLFATRKSSLHADLGIFMNRHSTVTSYLQVILLAVCGRIGVPGGNVIPGHLMPLGAHSDERNPKTWRTLETDFPAIMGTFPPNVLPEEIMADRPEAIRAVIVSAANPLRSYADTTAYEQAFKRLDLLVTIDVAMTETGLLSHYVLPAKSCYEKWDATFFSWTYPEIYFQLRRPVVEPIGEPLEESQIMIELAERLGFLPVIPDSLHEAAKANRMQFGMELMQFARAEPRAAKLLPFVLGKTLGKALGSTNLAAVWGMLQMAPESLRAAAAQLGFDPGLGMGEQLFQAILDHPEGLWIGKVDSSNGLSGVRTEDHRINVFIPELQDWARTIEAQSEEVALAQDPEFPLILMAGRHMDENANTIMRDPSWNEGRRRPCTLAMHSLDALKLELEDGQMVRIFTAAGQADIELETTESARRGHVVIPHGFGLIFQGRAHGVNVNRLTKNTHRDPLAATPLHRFVPCRVEALSPV